MTNNDVLRSIRYILNLNEAKLVEITALAGFTVRKDELVSYLKQEEEEGYVKCNDKVLAYFLEGLIIQRRGRQENKPAQPVDVFITNNSILKRLRVAFELKDSDIVELIGKSGRQVSTSELGSFFRRPDHRNYRECGNQFLRDLLRGLAS